MTKPETERLLRQAFGGGRSGQQRAQPEAAMLAALFEMICRYEDRYPVLKNVFHIPNSGDAGMAKRGVWMKQQGLRAGVWDCFCAVLVLDGDGIYIPGLWLELKVKPNKLSPAQVEFGARMKEQGYMTKVVYDDWQEAWREICLYLGLPGERLTGCSGA